MNKHCITGIGVLVCILMQSSTLCQAQTDDVLLRAMKDELQRNVTRLSLEGVSEPFFMSYQIKDNFGLTIQAASGAITRIDTSRHRGKNVRVLVGGYQQTQEHFVTTDMSFSYQQYGSNLPIEDDYDAIRRGLWLSTDRAYKAATEQLEKKRAAMQQQQIAEDIKELPDFSEAAPAQRIEEVPSRQVDAGDWKERIARLSAIFNAYPDIYLSNATISIKLAVVYFVNSEGTILRVPNTLASFQVTAATQAEDGETLDDFVTYNALSIDGIPSEEELGSEIHDMAKRLCAKREALAIDASYTGPVLFEDQAAAELFTRLYLGQEGLIASRMPIMEGPLAMLGAQMQKRNLGDKLNKRILPKSMSIASVPGMPQFDGAQLIGRFSIDAEGVTPSERLPLVQDGKVVALLADRIPTPHTKASTGHRGMSVGYGADDGRSPGVLEISVDKGLAFPDMKALLLEKADEEGLEYAYIVRRIRPETVSPPSLDDDFASSFSMMQFGGGGPTPLGDAVVLMRVRVADGIEIPVRSAEVLKPGASVLRRMSATSDRKAWNFTRDGESAVPGMGMFLSFGRSFAGIVGGIPTSIIAPRAVLIDEMEVRKEKRAYTPKPPLVHSPLAN